MEIRLQVGRVVELLLRPTTETKNSSHTSINHFATNVLDKIAPLLLHRARNRTRRCQKYVETKIGSLPTHKFQELTEANPEFGALPEEDVSNNPFYYMIEVYTDNYIELEMGRSRTQFRHIATGAMSVIHDILPPNTKHKDNPIPLKKILKKEGVWAVVKYGLGFNFDRNPREHTIWLTEKRREDIFSVLKKYIQEGKGSNKDIPFEEFRQYTSKLRNAFIYIPAGKCLL